MQNFIRRLPFSTAAWYDVHEWCIFHDSSLRKRLSIFIEVEKEYGNQHCSVHIKSIERIHSALCKNLIKIQNYLSMVSLYHLEINLRQTCRNLSQSEDNSTLHPLYLFENKVVPQHPSCLQLLGADGRMLLKITVDIFYWIQVQVPVLRPGYGRLPCQRHNI
jgi:hypothetical protein